MENKENSDLDKLKNILKKFIDFIEPFRPLLNAQNVRFVSENHWADDKILPSMLRKELEDIIDKCQLSNQPVNLVKHYKNFTENCCENNKAQLSFYSKLKECVQLWNEHVVMDAEQFLDRLFANAPNSDELREYDKRLVEKFAILERQNRFMNEKKSYEVDTMSKFVANLCNKFGIRTVSL